MNWGILATGTIANKFATTVNAMAAEGERLAAVGSRRAESAKAFAAQYNIPHWHASYEELAADPAVDAIYIATPNALHYENCKLCLEHGKPKSCMPWRKKSSFLSWKHSGFAFCRCMPNCSRCWRMG